MKLPAVVVGLVFAGLAPAATLKVPIGAGAVVVDGRLDEAVWQAAVKVSLNSPDFGSGFPAGGEARLAACGAYLCLAARLPESGRIVARSQGRNPTWWREDQLIWTFAVYINNRNRRLTLTVNPFGAYSFDSTAVATSRTADSEWIIEAAIP